MSEVLLVNVFFIITGAAVLVVAVFLCVLSWQVLKLVKLARRTMERVESGAEFIAEDARVFRKYLTGGTVAGKAFTSIMRAVRKAQESRSPRRPPEGGAWRDETDDL